MNDVFFFGENHLRIILPEQRKKIRKPIPIQFENENKNENEKQIKQILSGEFATIFLFKNGKAIEYLRYSKQNPQKIQIEENIQKVTVGSSNEAILTTEGNVLLLDDSESQSIDNFKSISSLIEDTKDRIIQDVITGANSIYLLTSNQNAYGIGSNFNGQLGFDSFYNTEKPILMMKNVSKIFSGNLFNSCFSFKFKSRIIWMRI
ncbi:hypothetical protein M0811_03321 [Anaeramoeba ignava]|uniref:Uncharacterized protein n=1 Tax=Anaeramoeba ignava TaxID=1746090 RepID=A0A9Q0L609_ANAIG|nr:hypothetical protein M0811_03321 [Anaeramoeba ignava]